MIKFKNCTASDFSEFCEFGFCMDWMVGWSVDASVVSIDNCADSDNSITKDYNGNNIILGENNLHYITGIKSFKSLDDGTSDFLRLAPVSPLINAGTSNISIYNTADIEGNPRPSAVGTVSIGAVEAVESQVRLHYFALKKLFPLKFLGGRVDEDLTIEGKYLDQAYYQGMQIKNEFFPDTAGRLLTRWQQVLGTFDLSSRMYYLAHKQGLLSKAYMVAVAHDQGYTATIIDSITSAFIVGDLTYPGVSHLPHAVYEQDEMFSWQMTCTADVPSANPDKLRAAIYAVMPAYTYVTFVF